MARREKHKAEQVVNLLRQIEAAVANGKTTTLACKEAEITEQTHYRWRREYGGLQVDQARRGKYPPAVGWGLYDVSRSKRLERGR
jgi:formylglycine-generating enzyme required for sulfatase activity